MKLVVVLLAAMVVLAACGSSTSSAQSKSTSSKKLDRSAHFTIAYANTTDFLSLFEQVQTGFVDAAKTLGDPITTYDNNLSATTALSNVALIINQHPKVAFEYNAVAGIGHALGKKLTAAGIACIAVNVPAPPCAWLNLNNPGLGRATAPVVAAKMKHLGWNGSNTRIILVQQATAGTNVNSVVRCFYSTLAKLVPDMSPAPCSSIVASTTTIGRTGVQVNTDGTETGAYTAVSEELSSIPSADHIVVFANNDSEEMGAWRAIVTAGRSSDALAAGVGGSADAMQQLRTNPHWIAEGALFPQGWGEVGVALAVAMLHGIKPPAVTYVPQVVLTKSTISQYYGSSNTVPKFLPPLVAADNYLRSEGILQRFGNIRGLK